MTVRSIHPNGVDGSNNPLQQGSADKDREKEITCREVLPEGSRQTDNPYHAGFQPIQSDDCRSVNKKFIETTKRRIWNNGRFSKEM
jgi:hypothetical protein